MLGGAGEDECEDTNFTISWLSLAFVLLAILIVCLSLVLIEAKVRYSAYAKDSELRSRLSVSRVSDTGR